MAKYNVEIVETLSRVVEVDAENYEDAQIQVEDMYSNEEVVLDWEDMESTEYKQYPSPKLNNSFVASINYEKESDLLVIEMENSPRSEFKCRSFEDLSISVELYLKNNVLLENEEELER